MLFSYADEVKPTIVSITVDFTVGYAVTIDLKKKKNTNNDSVLSFCFRY